MAGQGATEKERTELPELNHQRAQHECLLPLIFCHNKLLILCGETGDRPKSKKRDIRTTAKS